MEVTYHRVITAVQGVSLDVREGAIVALLGTNGAGKTTTLRAISGFIGLDDARVTDGSIAFHGERIDNRPPHEITARGIALVPERSKVFENLTVAENLEAVVPRRGAVRAGWPTLCGSTFRRSRSCALATPGCCRGASGRCLRSARRSPAHRACCWWTSFRRGWRR